MTLKSSAEQPLDGAAEEEPPPAHFTDPVAVTDGLVASALAGEKRRQQTQIELIASENLVSRAVLEALGHEISNKTLEGYPGRRFHGGGDFADQLENAVMERAQRLFGCRYVNAQPHSGTQANQAVFFSLLAPGDRILSLDLAAGGHLSHGARPNLSGRWFEAHHYRVDRDTGLIDYDALESQAVAIRPRLLIGGGSAYPRELDFPRMRAIADRVGAYFLVDMAHFAGLVAAGVHPSPIPHADLVTCTTTKTLRGPRGGLILAADGDWSRRLQAAVFPGVQGSLHTQVIAAKAVCLGEALRPEFKRYGLDVRDNARTLADALASRGIRLVSGGTDTHIVLLDLSARKLTGQAVQDALYAAGITCNKNPVPFDPPRPGEWTGVRLGTGAGTTRGLGRGEFQTLGHVIADLVEAAAEPSRLPGATAAAADAVASMCRRFPVYP